MFLYNFSALVTWMETYKQPDGSTVTQGKVSGNAIPVSVIGGNAAQAYDMALDSLPELPKNQLGRWSLTLLTISSVPN